MQLVTPGLVVVKPNLNPCALVLSATVSPPKTMPGSARNDPNQRMLEYQEAFRFYLAIPDQYVDTLIVLENSGADLGVFRDIADAAHTKKRIHLLNASSDYPAEMGKGYGEFMMLDQGLAALQAGGFAVDKRFWKVTGRLRIVNIEQILARAPDDFEIYCDLRNVPYVGDAFGGNRWMDLRVFGFNMTGYDRYLRGNYGLGIGLEAHLFEILYATIESGTGTGIVPRFNVQPAIEGFCGYNNKSYSSLEYRLKNLVRSSCRFVFPNLWL